jgi:hypothetical protein
MPPPVCLLYQEALGRCAPRLLRRVCPSSSARLSAAISLFMSFSPSGAYARTEKSEQIGKAGRGRVFFRFPSSSLPPSVSKRVHCSDFYILGASPKSHGCVPQSHIFAVAWALLDVANFSERRHDEVRRNRDSGSSLRRIDCQEGKRCMLVSLILVVNFSRGCAAGESATLFL